MHVKENVVNANITSISDDQYSFVEEPGEGAGGVYFGCDILF